MTALGDRAGKDCGPSEGVGGSISTMATGCEFNFAKSLQLLDSSGESQHATSVRKLEKRFLDWAAYLGVFAGGDGSLDQRLKRYPQHRDLVLWVLDMLNMNLLQTTVDASNPSSDESSDDEMDRRSVELDGIQKSINELDRLAIHIRQSSISSLDARVKAFGSRKPAEVSSFEAKAMLVVKGLYPEASESLRRHLGKSMTQRYTKLLYLRSHDKKLRADRRRDKRPLDGSMQTQPESTSLPARGSSPHQPVQDSSPVPPPKPVASRVSAGTSFESATLASDLGSRFTIPAAAEAKIPARRRAGASTVLGSRANVPNPPEFEDGEDRKPCPLCRKMYLKADFEDNEWWIGHVNEDLLPFTCISSSCLESPTFASRSDWRTHTTGDHGVFWRRDPRNPTSAAEYQEISDVGLLADVCPLCCLPLDEKRDKRAEIRQEIAPAEPKTASASARKSSQTVRFDVPQQEGEFVGRVAPDVETTKPAMTTNPPGHPKMNPVMNHIADHLQFLALLTPRLSVEMLSDGNTNNLSGSQAPRSNRGSGKTSPLDDDFGFDEENEPHNADEDMFLTGSPQDLARSQDEWIELVEPIDWRSHSAPLPSDVGEGVLENVGQEARSPDPLLQHLYQRQLLRRLWDQAYSGLKDKEPKLAEAYEKILSAELHRNDSSSVAPEPTENEIEGTWEKRCRQMERLVQEGLARIQKKTPIMQGINEGLEAVQAVRKVVDEAVTAAPEAAIAWAGVCLGIEILSNPITASIDNRKGIAYVLSRMEWYWNLASLLLDENKAKKSSAELRAQLEKHVVQLYEKLLTYQVKSICLYHRNLATVIGRDLIKFDDWDGQLSEIKDAEGAVQRDMEQYNTEESGKQLQTLTDTASALEMNLQNIHSAIQDQTRQQDRGHPFDKYEGILLNDLRVTDPRDDKKRIQDTKGGLLTDSYVWVLQNSNFRQWRDDQNQRLLWVKGDPGKGKTMLLCGIIDELEATRAQGKLLSYFFCQATDERLSTATAVLRGLIFMLLDQEPSLILHIKKKYDEAGKALFQDVNAWQAMSEIFINILQDPKLEGVYLLIDALNECVTDLNKLINLVIKASQSTSAKWLISSRNWPQIEERLHSVAHRLSLEVNAESVSAAVDSYIKFKISELSRLKNYQDNTACEDRPTTYKSYTVAVVCAIDFEMSAIRYMLDREHPRLATKEGDSNIYVLGELSGHNVVLACLPGSQGKGAAATVATNMARTFPSISWRLFVGIGGGVPSKKHDIRLGDVVVSMPEGQYGGVVQYDLGKETDDGFVLEGFLSPPPPLLRGAVVKMRSDHFVSENKAEEFLSAMLRKGRRLSVYQRPPSSLDILFEAGYSHDPTNTTCETCDGEKRVQRTPRDFEGPEIHYGLIASGDRVVRSTVKRDEVIRNVGDVLCFEMEAAGLMTEFPCIVIRGISDYADSHKNDDWQHYAAATAAACAKELLTYIDPMLVPAMSAVSAPSTDVALGRDKPVATFHGTGIQHSGSGNFSVGSDLSIG